MPLGEQPQQGQTQVVRTGHHHPGYVAYQGIKTLPEGVQADGLDFPSGCFPKQAAFIVRVFITRALDRCVFNCPLST